MKLKLFLLLSLLVSLPMLGQKTGVRGVVVDSQSGRPIADATVLLDAQGLSATTGPSGEFVINGARAGRDNLMVIGYGFKDAYQIIELKDGVMGDVGSISVQMSDFLANQEESGAFGEKLLTESELDDEEGTSQSIATLTGASDNPFYQAASYDFSIMRFRIRGYESQYSTTTINGIPMNEPVRGMFSYSMTGGMSHAFRNKATFLGLDPNAYTFGNIGGETNISTFAKDYAPGLRASVAYTNSNYQYRGMVTYSSGLSKKGWAFVASAVGRYANEGIIPGTFYNSWGYFLSLQKVFNPQHSLALTTFGAPTKRATNTWTVLEAYDLKNNNLYNPNWGWSDGKKRSKKIVESFSPAVLLNWLWTPKMGLSLNTGASFQKSFYNSSDFNRGNNLADPRPDYYKYMPSYVDNYYHSPEITDLYTYLWQNDESVSQINWDNLYMSNYLNNLEAERTGKSRPANYILEKRHSNYAMWNFASTLNMRITDWWVLNGGVTFNYTVSSYYKTVKDLMGGAYWSDYDTFAERDYPDNPSIAENDLNHPNRKVHEKERFGYDYNILSLKAGIWKQFVFNLPKWDIYYSLMATYSTFQREGFMRNGRAPENSYGKGDTHEFINVAFKAGATYKLDGRNSFTAHLYYGTQPPLANNAYVSPRTKDDVIVNLRSEKIFSADLTYAMNYRIFRGYVSAFYTDMRNGTERTIYYDDEYATSINYALTGVHRVHKGVEVGAAIKLTPSITLNAAANIARYQYKNRPIGIKNLENGAQPDVYNVVYLKNFYVSGTPQEAYSVAINWNAPKQWYLTLKGAWLNRSYVQLSYVRHEEMPDLWTKYDTQEALEAAIEQISTQEKLNEAFVVGASIGHSFRICRIPFSLNVNIDNLFNNKNIMTSGMQQGRFDRQEYNTSKWPNKYYFAQGFKIFVNLSMRL